MTNDAKTVVRIASKTPGWRLGAKRQNTGTRRDRGAALLSALLVVSVVATLAVSSNWRVWRGIELEKAERTRQQAAWILQGALDWARLILREDAKSGEIDHLSEPWALPLAESKLARFLDEKRDALSADDRLFDAFLSGQISDMQARLNVSNLVQNGQIVPSVWRQWQRLYQALQLPEAELSTWVQGLQQAQMQTPTQTAANTAKTPKSRPAVALAPQQLSDLLNWGLSGASLQKLAPYACVLPMVTPVNLNTASAIVLQASLPQLNAVQAQRAVLQRQQNPFKDVNQALQSLGQNPQEGSNPNNFSVSSQFFEVQGRLRLQGLSVLQQALVQRQGQSVAVLWRHVGAAAP